MVVHLRLSVLLLKTIHVFVSTPDEGVGQLSHLTQAAAWLRYEERKDSSVYAVRSLL